MIAMGAGVRLMESPVVARRAGSLLWRSMIKVDQHALLCEDR